ncbi:MAG: FAD-binding oxidoreductase [Simplicispira sp.]|nr:FAD-binding oxidoreductase [Simplicispira sp.]
MSTVDFAIVGAGIAGASLGWELAAHGSVLLLEREPCPGTTPRRFGGAVPGNLRHAGDRAMTRASRRFLQSPPPGFCDSANPRARGVVHIAGPDQLDLLDATEAELRTIRPARTPVGRCPGRTHPVCAARALGGGLREGARRHRRHRLHLGLSARAKAAAARCAPMPKWSQPSAATGYETHTADGSHAGTHLINAAGAWADVLGAMAAPPHWSLAVPAHCPLPFRRRTAWICADAAIIAVDESFSSSPTRQLLGSPANADLMTRTDVARLRRSTSPPHLSHRADDASPSAAPHINGCALLCRTARWRSRWAAVDGLFWLAAQGGYGIQSASVCRPAGAQPRAGRGAGRDFPAGAGCDPAVMSPARLR